MAVGNFDDIVRELKQIYSTARRNSSHMPLTNPDGNSTGIAYAWDIPGLDGDTFSIYGSTPEEAMQKAIEEAGPRTAALWTSCYLCIDGKKQWEIFPEKREE